MTLAAGSSALAQRDAQRSRARAPLPRMPIIPKPGERRMLAHAAGLGRSSCVR